MTTFAIALFILMLAVMPISAADEPVADEQTTAQTTSSPQGINLFFILIGLGAVTAVGIARWSNEIMRSKSQ